MHPSDGRVVSNFIVQALLGDDITLYGDGSQTRSFCFVDDLVDGLVALVEAPDTVNYPVNIGNPVESSIKDLANILHKLTRSRSGIVQRDLPVDDPKQRCPDIELAREVLGWQPRVALEDGLKKTIPYFSKQIEARRDGSLSRG